MSVSRVKNPGPILTTEAGQSSFTRHYYYLVSRASGYYFDLNHRIAIIYGKVAKSHTIVLYKL